MHMADSLGFVAGALTTFGLIPQVIRVFQLKSAREISLLFTLLFLVGGLTWLTYGIFARLVPVIFWNAVTTALVVGLLVGKLRYGKVDGK